MSYVMVGAAVTPRPGSPTTRKKKKKIKKAPVRRRLRPRGVPGFVPFPKAKFLVKGRPLVLPGLALGHLKIKKAVYRLPTGVKPGTVVATPLGPATAIATPIGPVAVPGAVPAPPGTPAGASVDTAAGPATAVPTPSGPVAVPDSATGGGGGGGGPAGAPEAPPPSEEEMEEAAPPPEAPPEKEEAKEEKKPLPTWVWIAGGAALILLLTR